MNETDSKIIQGSVVRLKSGGHKMTVHDIDGDDIVCVWFAPIGYFAASKSNEELPSYAAEPNSETFPRACLELIG